MIYAILPAMLLLSAWAQMPGAPDFQQRSGRTVESNRALQYASVTERPGAQLTGALSRSRTIAVSGLCSDPVKSAVVPEPPATATVSGRVELLNARSKGRNGRVDASGVVVWLEPINGGSARAQRPRQRIIQRSKRFTPHVLAVEKGTEVDFPNLDPFFHNVFSLFEGRRFDLGLYDSGESRPVSFNRAGISYIFCNIHPQMSAIVLTLDTPWFAVSDESGGITINDVPAGAYRVQVWHERTKEAELQAQSRAIQITGGSFSLGVLQLNEAGYVPRPHANKHGRPYDTERNKPAYRRP